MPKISHVLLNGALGLGFAYVLFKKVHRAGGGNGFVFEEVLRFGAMFQLLRTITEACKLLHKD